MGNLVHSCASVNPDLGGKVSNAFQSTGQERFGRDELVDEADVESLARRDGFAEEEELKSAGAAKEAREALGASPAGQQAERRAGVAEEGIGRSEAAVAGEGEVEPAAETVAADGGEDGLA